jgi:uncharacterized repeat protein (TIGR01451 family)
MNCNRQKRVSSNQRFVAAPWLFVFLLSMMTVGLSGCTRFQVPQIDPTGQRIFLPGAQTGAADWLQTKQQQIGRAISNGPLPNSAFPTPAPPPACVEPTVPKPKLFGDCLRGRDRGECGELLMTPLRIVAPVNGDVVLLAGICGEDGYLVTQEPIEWMLSPESVGTFIEVGDDAKGQTVASWSRRPRVEKLDVDFAKGRTSVRDTLITRGSQKKSDDLQLRKGQTWISLSSPVEGVSRVTALAPDSEIWNRRRQTATIHWIDAQWQFPQNQVYTFGQTATLKTKVVKSSGFDATKGYEVRYRSLNPDVAVFLPNRSAEATAEVDREGNATVQLINLAPGPAAALIAMEVVRTEKANESFDDLPLGNGQTLVTWSAPQLQLNVTGPTDALPGQTQTYFVALANTGDAPAEGVILSFETPAGMTFENANPPERRITPTTAAWDIGQIPARQQFNVAVRLTPQSEANYAVAFDASGGPGLRARDEILTRVEQPSLDVQIIPRRNQQQYDVGDVVDVDVVVANRNRRSLSNVSVQIVAGEGLESVRQLSNTLDITIPILQVGQQQPISESFRVRQPGVSPLRVVVSLDGKTLASTSLDISGVAPRPKVPKISLTVESLNGVKTLAANQEEAFSILIENTGELPLSNLVIDNQYGRGLDGVSAFGKDQNRVTLTVDPDDRRLRWQVATLGVAEILRLPVVVRANGQSSDGLVIATVETREQVRDEGRLEYTLQPAVLPDGNVVPEPNVLPDGGNVVPNAPSQGPVNNRYSLSITDGRETLPQGTDYTVGQPVNYIVTMQNMRDDFDQALELLIKPSAGMRFESIALVGGGVLQPIPFGETSIQTRPIQSIRGGETIRWRIQMIPTQAGEVGIEVQAQSAGQTLLTRQLRGIAVRRDAASLLPE